jgi:hypothetical protein
VELTTPSGKFVAALPITNTILSLSPPDTHGGSKLVLAVTAGRSVPPHREYEPGITLGLLEDITMVPVDASELPENPIGYDAVDAILWLDASPDELTSGGDERLRALQNWVRGGGHLVICQQTDQWQKTLGFGDFLPVSINGVRTKDDAEPLRTLARGHENTNGGTLIDPWDYMHGPMTLGVAIAKPGAFVDEWITWPNEGKLGDGKSGVDLTPYIARKSYGCGCVTWVAQDLGDRSLSSTDVKGQRMETIHWPLIWNRVFNWHDDPLVADRVSDQQKGWYPESAETVDIAGPGAFFFLLSKGKSGANWFVFAAAALVFTFLTVLLVDVIVRGPPDLKHFSVVRATPAQADSPPLAHVYSRFGLYIPRDGEQTLEIKDSAPGTAADLGPYAIPPKDLGDNAPNDIGPQYVVPIADASSGESTVVRFPYRRTLKKLEASWTGDPTATGLSGGIEGTGKLVYRPDYLEGKLTNGTGRKLRNVYFVYRWHASNPDEDTRNVDDYLIYLPEWDPGVTLDLASDLRTETDKDGNSHPIESVRPDGANPDDGRKCQGRVQKEWEAYWMHNLAGSMTGDATMDKDHALIVLSLFDRLAPNQRLDPTTDRLELVRRGARMLDCTSALTAGSMVIIAGEDIPGPSGLPIPLEVDGDKVDGNGQRLYQFIVPMDNTFETMPTTQASQ